MQSAGSAQRAGRRGPQARSAESTQQPAVRWDLGPAKGAQRAARQGSRGWSAGSIRQPADRHAGGRGAESVIPCVETVMVEMPVVGRKHCDGMGRKYCDGMRSMRKGEATNSQKLPRRKAVCGGCPTIQTLKTFEIRMPVWTSGHTAHKVEHLKNLRTNRCAGTTFTSVKRARLAQSLITAAFHWYKLV